MRFVPIIVRCCGVGLLTLTAFGHAPAAAVIAAAMLSVAAAVEHVRDNRIPAPSPGNPGQLAMRAPDDNECDIDKLFEQLISNAEERVVDSDWGESIRPAAAHMRPHTTPVDLQFRR